jgi:Zn-dependent protease
MMLVALAGPGSNLVLALIGAVLLGLFTRDIYGVAAGSVSAFVAANLLNFVIINVFLAIFNLIPLPPFDGGHVVAGLLPERLAQRWDRLARFGFPLLIVLLLVLPTLVPGANIVQRLVAPPAQALAEWYLALAGAIGR